MMRRSPSTTCVNLSRAFMLSLVRAFSTSFVAVAAICACAFEPDAWDSSNVTTSATSTWKYQTSRFDMVAIWRIDSRYD